MQNKLLFLIFLLLLNIEIKAQYLTYFVGIINRLFLIKKKEAIENIFDY